MCTGSNVGTRFTLHSLTKHARCFPNENKPKNEHNHDEYAQSCLHRRTHSATATLLLTSTTVPADRMSNAIARRPQAETRIRRRATGLLRGKSNPPA